MANGWDNFVNGWNDFWNDFGSQVSSWFDSFFQPASPEAPGPAAGAELDQSAETVLDSEAIQQIVQQHQQFGAAAALQQQEAAQASADRAMQFEHDEAQLLRDWYDQQRSNSYQVAVEDMKKAGLNPALAFQQGGAPVVSSAMPSGNSASMSKAEVDMDTLTSILETYLEITSAEDIANSKNRTQLLNTVLGALVGK